MKRWQELEHIYQAVCFYAQPKSTQLLLAIKHVLTHAHGRYGAQEACSEPSFSLESLPLLDRGFVYAIARAWAFWPTLYP